jgi:hypothetical protein
MSNSQLCSLSCTIFLLSASVIIVVPFALCLSVITSPITVPTYFYHKKRYTRWLEKWKLGLDISQIQSVENYIHGPIVIDEFIKYSSTAYLFSRVSSSKSVKPPKHVPKCFLSLQSPCYGSNETNFMKSMNYMLSQLNIDHQQETSYRHVKTILIDKNNICNICLDDEKVLTMINSNITKCFHIFHNSCLTKWKLKQESDNEQPSCPICREYLNIL